MVVNRKLLLKNKPYLQDLFACKSSRGLLSQLQKATLPQLKLLTAIFVDVVYKKIPLVTPELKNKLKKEQEHLKQMASNYNQLRCEKNRFEGHMTFVLKMEG